MITIRPADERGRTQLDWLDGRHSFSFGEYYDPAHMAFQSLRVINDDRVAPGGGFGMHPHRDMEIVTYVLEGALEHKDSLGNGSVIQAGDVQYMGAGAGVRHSEFNHSPDEPVRLLQIWIEPAKKGLQPAYQQFALEPAKLNGKLYRLPVEIRQDAQIYATKLAAGDQVTHPLAPHRHAWVQVARGSVTLNGHKLREGDGAAVDGETSLNISSAGASEVLVFDLA